MAKNQTNNSTNRTTDRTTDSTQKTTNRTQQSSTSRTNNSTNSTNASSMSRPSEAAHPQGCPRYRRRSCRPQAADEGRRPRRNPLPGSRGNFAPHPSWVGHLPPQGKAFCFIPAYTRPTTR